MAAAAFGGTRETLGGVPQLTPTEEQVLRKCGKHVDVLLESLVTSEQQNRRTLGQLFIEAQVAEQRMTGRLTVLHRPLLRTLQADCVSCDHCSPWNRLRIQSCSLSGTCLEGTMSLPHPLGNGMYARELTRVTLVEFGPVSWVESTAGGSPDSAGGEDDEGSAAADTGGQSGTSTPRLIAIRTESPRSVLLMQEKKDGCKHQVKQCFGSDSFIQLLRDYWYCMYATEALYYPTPSRPAAAFHEERRDQIEQDGYDVVPCLRATWWPSDEFFKRRRTCDWPPAAARDDIKSFGIHLIAAGDRGNGVLSEQWDISFFRAEAVAAWHLTPTQLSSLIASRACLAALGPEGKVVHYYHLKMTLFWLCQETPAEHWKSIMQGLMMMMDYLEKAINDRYLPCFFWADINVLRTFPTDRLDMMRRAIGLIRRHATRLLAHELSIARPLAAKVLHHPSHQLSESQLRICLVAHLLTDAVTIGLVGVAMDGLSQRDATIRLLLRSSAKEELAHCVHEVVPKASLQVALLSLLTVAPGSVVSRCRLTSRRCSLFSWDAAPLVALLTPRDLQELLGDPAAVSAWLESQRHLPPEQRPTGLPSEDLSSPRAKTDLLLNLPLLARALKESATVTWERIVGRATHPTYVKFKEAREQLPPFAEAKRLGLEYSKKEQRIAYVLHHNLHIEKQTALDRASFLGDSIRRFFADPGTEAEYNSIRTRLPDSWRLRQYVFAKSD